MRYLISVLLLTALIVGWQRPGFAQSPVSGIVVEGQEFFLGWPQHAPKAFIRIPVEAIGSGPGPWPGQVAPGTIIAIKLETESREQKLDHPPPFKDHPKKVFPPIIVLETDPQFAIANKNHWFTIGMCVQYHPQETSQFNNAELVRAVGDALVPFLPAPKSELCALRSGGPGGCRPGPPHCPNQEGASTTFLRQLFAGSPFSPTPLYAFPEPEGGLGGRGGSGSPIAAVEQ
jgi:hypothetical protein